MTNKGAAVPWSVPVPVQPERVPTLAIGALFSDLEGEFRRLSCDPQTDECVYVAAMSERFEVSVMWFRRDLRLRDNPALIEAANQSRRVVALYVVDPDEFDRFGAPKQAFVVASLAALDGDLDNRLCIRSGEPSSVVAAVAKEANADAVFCAAGAFGLETAVEDSVDKTLGDAGCRLNAVGSPYVIDPGFIVNDQGGPYKVFMPYFNRWLAHDPGEVRQAPRNLDLIKLASDPLPTVPKVDCQIPEPGEVGAKNRLARFLESGLENYEVKRDHPGVEGTSMLSAYLNIGCIHPRQVIAAVRTKKHERDKNAVAFVREIAFRDFYADSVFHNPWLVNQSMDGKLSRLEQDSGDLADHRFEAWCKGMTGYPIVDAGMRQLLATGWMHNRVRMIVASFLVKDLHIDWQRGAQWFMDHLVDGDEANNSLGWQWVAGTGPGAAPFFRVFNPVTQSEKFDKAAKFIRAYVEELQDVPDRYVHAPWKDPDGLPSNYPAPIVDHAEERRDALARYSKL